MTRPPKSPDKLLARSGLGAEANAAVRATVRATRLWPREKGDVCRELIAHFRDGREAGVDEASLVRDFGDPRAAARLIRRAKRRQRPLAWHAAMWGVRGVAGVFAFMLCVYAVLAWRYYSATPVIKRDYLAEINAVAAAVPESERAWPVYRRVVAGLLPQDGNAANVRSMVLRSQPGWDQWEEAKSLAASHQAELAAIRRAAAMPVLGFVASSRVSEEDAQALGLTPGPSDPSDPMSGSLMTALVPHLGAMKTVCGWLALDARVAAESGDGVRAVDNLVAMLRIGGQVRENRLLISHLVGCSVYALASVEACRLLERHPDLFTNEQASQLARALAGTPADLTIDLAAERAMVFDLIQRIYTDDGDGDGRLTPAWSRVLWPSITDEQVASGTKLDAAVGPLAMALAPSRRELEREVVRFYDRLQALVRDPIIPRESTDAVTERMLAESRAGAVLRIIVPAFSSSANSARGAAMEIDAARAIIALELHRRMNGALPASLDELVPRLLPSVPLDRYDGKPLRYLVQDGGVLLYSVANDRIDNGGVAASPFGKAGSGLSAPLGTDWVFYPPPREPPPQTPEDEHAACRAP